MSIEEQNLNGAENPQLNIGAVSGSYIYRNEYPKCVEILWDKLPEEGQRVEVDYGNSTNCYIWFVGGKFVNKYGFEMNGVMGWRPYNCH